MATTKRLPFLGRRRAKVKKSPTEWVETLVPSEAGDEAPAVDTPDVGSPGPTSLRGAAPPARGPDLPGEADMRTLRSEYVPRSPMTMKEIRSYIDDHLPSKRLPPPLRPKKAPPPIGPVSRSRGKPARIVGVPVSGDVVDQRIVYETPGGFVLEVTERGANGALDKSYYTISKVSQVAHALDALRAGGAPPAADATSGPAPSFAEAKRALDETPPAQPTEPAPRDEPWSDPVPPSTSEAPTWDEPAAPTPADEAGGAPAAESEATDDAPGRLGRLAGRFKFGRKKEGSEAGDAAAATPTEEEPATGEGAEGGRFGRLKGIFSKKKEGETGPDAAAAPADDPAPAEDDASGGRFARLKKLRFRKGDKAA